MTTVFQDGSIDAAEPTIYPATVEGRPRSQWRLTLVALALTLILGAVGGGWMVLYYNEQNVQQADGTAPAALAPGAGKVPLARPVAVAPQPLATPALTGADATTVAARVAQIEDRLARLSLTAESASGNAAKAEAILDAFAARRALDRGLPLGPMEAQLRLRFGESQPNAVESILSASARPVTQEDLLRRLDAMRPIAMADSNAGWLTRMGNSLSGLIVIRSADAPSAAPVRRFERAQRAVEGGRVDEAIGEVMALPGAENELVRQWLDDARRYNDARRALDLIETAAIVEPGQNREADKAAVATAAPGVP
jgi:hypothetical protein